MSVFSNAGWPRRAGWVLLILLAMRMLAMALVPLTDTTEARYAEIARKMLETGNWVTLLHDYGVPFWAKPPLSTWLSAASMAVFGVNEFAARLPSLLLAIGTVGLIAGLAASRARPASGNTVMATAAATERALAAALLLAGGMMFFIAAGTVMTDMALLFSVTLSLVAFWRALHPGVGQHQRRWGLLFFVGLGLGLLAKGPIAIVLAGLVIGPWVLLTWAWGSLWRRLPWMGGIALMLAISLPWYLLAEARTPGFLDYFIMGEHVSRFLSPGWQGDKYGFAHAVPRGTIWLYALGAALPWSLAALAWLARRHQWRLLFADRGGDRSGAADNGVSGAGDVGGVGGAPAQRWVLYLLLWSVMPLAFFTMSRNIIAPYVLPMLPGLALLMTEFWARGHAPGTRSRLPEVALFTALAIAIATALFVVMPERLARTQKPLVALWLAQQPAADAKLLYWGGQRQFSAEFYSAGRARSVVDAQAVLNALATPGKTYLAVPRDELERLSLPASLTEPLLQRFRPVPLSASGGAAGPAANADAAAGADRLDSTRFVLLEAVGPSADGSSVVGSSAASPSR